MEGVSEEREENNKKSKNLFKNNDEICEAQLVNFFLFYLN